MEATIRGNKARPETRGNKAKPKIKDKQIIITKDVPHKNNTLMKLYVEGSKRQIRNTRNIEKQPITITLRTAELADQVRNGKTRRFSKGQNRMAKAVIDTERKEKDSSESRI